jgi:hypothetical protein
MRDALQIGAAMVAVKLALLIPVLLLGWMTLR